MNGIFRRDHDSPAPATFLAILVTYLSQFWRFWTNHSTTSETTYRGMSLGVRNIILELVPLKDTDEGLSSQISVEEKPQT